MLRKIESKEDIERRRKRNMLLISGIMIAILVFSTAGYFVGESGSDSGSEINQTGVQEMGSDWVLQFGDQILRFSSSPESVKNVSLKMNFTLESYYGKTVYVSSEKDGITEEIALNLGRYTQRMQPACYGNCSKNVPEKDCTNLMIVYTSRDEGKVYQSGNCVFIEGDIRAVDAFLYRLFGVN